MRRGGPVSGAVTLVMIFAVLCMAVFAVLSVSTAEQAMALSELAASQAKNYYAADREAVFKAAALGSGAADVEGVTADADGGTAAFSEPIDDNQTLEVSLDITDGGVRVRRWETVYTGESAPDDMILLWDGE